MVMGTEDDGWSRLGREVRRRRDELGMSQAKAAALASARPVDRDLIGLSVQTWAVIEQGKRPKSKKRRDHVLADLSWALGWTDDSAQRIIDGEPPVERPAPDEVRAGDESQPVDDDHILQTVQDACRAILELIENRRR
jgi:transcriptional regulator with XRE-family HTH domain